MASVHARTRSLAFVAVGDESPKLSLIIEAKQPIVPINGIIHLWLELDNNQIALQLREYANYLTKANL